MFNSHFKSRFTPAGYSEAAKKLSRRSMEATGVSQLSPQERSTILAMLEEYTTALSIYHNVLEKPAEDDNDIAGCLLSNIEYVAPSTLLQRLYRCVCYTILRADLRTTFNELNSANIHDLFETYFLISWDTDDRLNAGTTEQLKITDLKVYQSEEIAIEKLWLNIEMFKKSSTSLIAPLAR